MTLFLSSIKPNEEGTGVGNVSGALRERSEAMVSEEEKQPSLNIRGEEIEATKEGRVEVM